jgi:hypothetical protein
VHARIKCSDACTTYRNCSYAGQTTGQTYAVKVIDKASLEPEDVQALELEVSKHSFTTSNLQASISRLNCTSIIH